MFAADWPRYCPARVKMGRHAGRSTISATVTGRPRRAVPARAGGFDDLMAKFAGGTERAKVKFAVKDDPAADAGAKRVEEHVGGGVAEAELAESGRAGVVEDTDGDAEFGLQSTSQRDAAPLGGEVGEEQHITVRTINQTRYPAALGAGGNRRIAADREDAGDHVVGSAVGFGGDSSLGDLRWETFVGRPRRRRGVRGHQRSSFCRGLWPRREHRRQDTL